MSIIRDARYVHTNLIARDWQALARFYEEVFGCVRVPPERDLAGADVEAGTGVCGARLRGMHLRLPGQGAAGPTLEIFSYNRLEKRPRVAVNRPGYGHIAFGVDDVPASRDAILAAGGGPVGRVVTVALSDGLLVTWCYVTDPEGNVIELQSRFAFLDPGPLIDDDLELALAEWYPGDPARRYVPAYRFRMTLADQGTEIGTIEVRIGNPEHLVRYGGHIGYRVVPEHRGHRYAARACRLLLPLARRHGMTTLWITCNPDNWASRRTCELAGGRLVEIVDLPEDNDMYRHGDRQKCRYRVDLDEGL